MTTHNTALLLAAGLATALGTACTSGNWQATVDAPVVAAEPRNTTEARAEPREAQPAQMPPNDPLALSISGIQTEQRARSEGFGASLASFDGTPPSTATMQPEALARSAFADTRGPGGNLMQVTFALDGADFDPDVSRDG